MSDVARKAPSSLRPLNAGLSPEVQQWVGELRMIWDTVGLSMSDFASLYPIDKGTISRYLHGQRVPRESWFLDKLLAIQADKGTQVTSAVCEHLTTLHLRALQVAHPHEYRVRLVSDELKVAIAGKLEAEHYARSLEEQLAERNRQVQGLTDEKGRLRAAWDADRMAMQAEYERLIREIDEISRQLHLAWKRAAKAEQRCEKLAAIRDLLDAYPAAEQDCDESLEPDSHAIEPDAYPLSLMTQQTLRLLSNRPPGRALDISAGKGTSAIRLALLGYEVDAVEANRVGAQEIERFAAEVGVKLRVFASYVEDFVPDESYDVIVCNGLLHYVADKYRVISLMQHATWPGGINVVSLWSSHTPLSEFHETLPLYCDAEDGVVTQAYREWCKEFFYFERNRLERHGDLPPHRHSYIRLIARKP